MARRALGKTDSLLVCPICLDTLKEPVTIPCGHSYCRGCLELCWGQHGADTGHSCPQCREAFTPRPALNKNNILAQLVDDLHKKEMSAPGTAPQDEESANNSEELTAEGSLVQPGDVLCDMCVDQNVKASKSCLQCLASFCSEHLRPHSQAAPLKKHRLVEPLQSLQDNCCPEHNEVKKLFCQTDAKCICTICCWDGHERHQVVYVAVERSRRQEKIAPSREIIQKSIISKRQEVQELQQEALSIHRSADEAVKMNEDVFLELTNLLSKQRVEFSSRIRAEETERVRSVEALQSQLLHEITELEKHDKQLDELSKAEDHNMFLETYLSLPKINEYKESFQAAPRPLCYFQDTQAALAQLNHQVQNAALVEQENVLEVIKQPDVLLTEPQPETRPEFLKYARNMTFDLESASDFTTISDSNREVTVRNRSLSILSKEKFTQRCYFEVCFSDNPSIAVSYKQTLYRLDLFGKNDSSWALRYHTTGSNSGFKYYHNKTESEVQCKVGPTVGVFVDHRAGILSFYQVEKDSMQLIHKVQTTFTQPLYAGVCLPESKRFIIFPRATFQKLT